MNYALLVFALLFGLAAIFMTGVIAFVLIEHLRFVRFHKRENRQIKRSFTFWLKLWTKESIAIARVAFWALFRPALKEKDAPHVVLCVHGFVGHKTNWRALRLLLNKRNIASHTVALGFPPQELDDYVPPLRRKLAELRAQGSTRIDVVCHSMGGVVLRRLLTQEPSWEHHLGRIITVGSPHTGTASVPKYLGYEVGALRWKNPELVESCALPSAPQKWLSIASDVDYVVYPLETTSLPDVAHNIILSTGHSGLLTDKESLRAIMAFLESKDSVAASE